MKQIKSLFLLLILLLSFGLVGCSEKESDKLVLRIYNWQDYIDEGIDEEGNTTGSSVMDDWCSWYYETYGVEVEVVYDTFETNEVMMNTLKTGKTTYDLICPSEYTIQKMMKLGMLEEYDYDLKDANGDVILSNYEYVSPYLKDLFSSKGWDKYAIGYMWGTMGFIYNPEVVDEEDVKHWSILWDSNYKNMATAKDSVRDTYVVGAMYVYYDELMDLRSDYLNGVIDGDTYTSKVGEIMNRCGDDDIEKIGEALKEMKKNIYGFEVDSGKSDIVTGKVSINFAWSGDAVYSLDIAEEESELYLNYSVPEEGSNIWFDGWVMPKGANKELAQSFVNYLCSPEIAVRNMNYIGYTSSIVGDEILDMIDDWYGATFPEFDSELNSWVYGYDDYIANLNISDSSLEVSVVDNEIYLGDMKVVDLLSEILDEDNNPYSDYYPATCYEVDLTYLFDGAVSSDYLDDENRVIVCVEERGRQFDTQYPDSETILRCGIMEDFNEQNDKVLAMWEDVKIGDIHPSITIILVCVIVASLGYLYISRYIRYKQKQRFRKK